MTDGATNISKTERTAGALNIVLGGVLLVDSALIGTVAVVCVLMSFTLFFLAALPSFFISGLLFFITIAAAVANFVTGFGTVIASGKNVKVSNAFNIVTIVVDAIVIPANVVALLCGMYLLASEVIGVAVVLLIVAALAVILASVSLILSIVRLNEKNRR